MTTDSENLLIRTAVLRLAQFGIPPDMQELLVFGNVGLGIPPGALSAAINAALEVNQDNGFDLLPKLEIKVRREELES